MLVFGAVGMALRTENVLSSGEGMELGTGGAVATNVFAWGTAPGG